MLVFFSSMGGSSTNAASKVGGYIKSYCNRCHLDLGHTIVAVVSGVPARVRCDTCRSERNYRAPKTPKEILSQPRERVKAARKAEPATYALKMKELAGENARPYRFDETFKVGDVVEHPSFGRGAVVKTIFPDRMDVLFSEGEKTLACKVSD